MGMDKHLWSRSETKQWTIVLFCGTVVLYAARVALPICVVAIAEEYSWTKTDSGAVLACFFWGYASTQALSGYLADKLGGDNVLVTSTVVWSLITLATPAIFRLAYATEAPIALLTVMRVVMGAAQGFHFPSTASLVSQRQVAAEKGRVFGVVTSGSNFGTVICGSLGSYVLSVYGWRFVFYTIGIMGLGWAVILHSLSTRRKLSRPNEGFLPLVESKSRISRSVDKNATALKSPSKEHDLNSPANKSRPVPWLYLLRQPGFIAAFIAHYCGSNAFYTLFSWLPSYFAEVYPTEAKGWVFNVVPYASVACTSLLVPYAAMHLLQKGRDLTFVRRFMEGVSLIGIALCLFGVSSVSSYMSAISLLTLAMAFRGLHYAGITVNPQDFAPNHTGAVFGVMNMASAIPGFIGVYVAGYLLQTFHSWPYVFAVTGAQCILGAVVYTCWGTAKQLI